mmetsp:Transcript_507/g.1527  ORF Transcript_507/g.1527 Transcript_507/m.1527 type:complete len:92 (+) Transcript_507:149-424(+)
MRARVAEVDKAMEDLQGCYDRERGEAAKLLEEERQAAARGLAAAEAEAARAREKRTADREANRRRAEAEGARAAGQSQQVRLEVAARWGGT